MEYPNIEYILTYGSEKTEDDKFIKGLFIAKKQKVVDQDLKGLIIVPDIHNEEDLNGNQLEIHEKFIKDKTTGTIYSWNDLMIGIEEEKVYLVTSESNPQKNKKLWELPQMLFNYLEIKYCYIYSIVIHNSKLCIQMIKYRTTLNNKNKVLWCEPVIIPDKNKHLHILKDYQHNSDITLILPKISTTKGLDNDKYKKILDSIYFIIHNKKIYLKDIELTKKNNTLQIVTKIINNNGHLLGFIFTKNRNMGDT